MTTDPTEKLKFAGRSESCPICRRDSDHRCLADCRDNSAGAVRRRSQELGQSDENPPPPTEAPAMIFETVANSK